MSSAELWLSSSVSLFESEVSLASGQDWLGFQDITEGIVCVMVVGITRVIWVLLRRVVGLSVVDGKG